MPLIYRTSSIANVVPSFIKNSPLTYEEGDGNIAYLLTNMSGSSISIVGNTLLEGELQIDGQLYLPEITELSKDSVLTFDTSSGRVYFTSSTAVGGQSAVLTSNLTTNITVGGLPAGSSYSIGDPLEDILRAMLITYIAPTLGGITLLNDGSTVLNSSIVREVGNGLGPFNTASFSATADDPDGRFAYSSSFTASGATTGDFSTYFGDNVLSTSNNFGLAGSRTVTRTSPGTVTFTLNAKNPENMSTISQTRTVTYVYPFFHGMSATDYSTTGDLYSDGGITTLVATGGNKSLSISGNLKYIYFAYPASYGDLSSIIDGNGYNVTTAFTKYTRTQSSVGWSSVSYNIYRTTLLTTVNPAQTYTLNF